MWALKTTKRQRAGRRRIGACRPPVDALRRWLQAGLERPNRRGLHRPFQPSGVLVRSRFWRQPVVGAEDAPLRRSSSDVKRGWSPDNRTMPWPKYASGVVSAGALGVPPLDGRRPAIVDATRSGSWCVSAIGNRVAWSTSAHHPAHPGATCWQPAKYLCWPTSLSPLSVQVPQGTPSASGHRGFPGQGRHYPSTMAMGPPSHTVALKWGTP
jgi:hypothetical protein